MIKYLSYSLGIFLIVAGVASLTQSANVNFLVSADAAKLSTTKSSVVLAIIGTIFFLLGALIIILKIIKGRVKHG